MEQEEKKNKFLYYSIILLLLLTNIIPMFFLQKNAYASSAYYNDNAYESSSTYASIEQNENNIIKEVDEITEEASLNHINATTKTIKNDKTKKIYNTIIVKTKRKKNEDIKKPEKVIKENDEEEEIEEIEEKKETKKQKVVKKEEKNEEKNEEKTEDKENQKLSKLDTLRYYMNSTRVKRPDPWYLYALFGYSLGLPKTLEASAVFDSTEASNSAYNAIKASGTSVINGWGFTAGVKKYINRNIFAFYVSFETFYNRLTINKLSYSYDTLQSAYIYNVNVDESDEHGHKVYETNIKIPANISIAPKSVFGGSLRIGFTIANVVSIFGKANIGGLNQMISSNINFNDFYIGDVISNNGGARGNDIKTRIVNDFKAKTPITAEQKKYMSFIYGFGGGAELTLWNQHVIFRVDYDHYFGTNTFSVDKQFSRKQAPTQNYSSKTLELVKNNETGTKWKVKNSFGILKVTVGVSF